MGGSGRILLYVLLVTFTPSQWVTATSLQVFRMAQFELLGGFAFGKQPSDGLYSMKTTRRLWESPGP